MNNPRWTLPSSAILSVFLNLLMVNGTCLADGQVQDASNGAQTKTNQSEMPAAKEADKPPAPTVETEGATARKETEIDFGPYMADLQTRIRQHWFPPKQGETKRVSVIFKIHKGGELSELRIDKTSGVAAADSLALKAVTSAAPFRPLPAGAPEVVDIQFTFDYNISNFKIREPELRAKLLELEKTSGLNDPALLPTLAELADCLRQQDQFIAAEQIYKRAVSIAKQSSSQLAPLAGLYEGFAYCKQHQNRHAEAETLYKQALSLNEAKFGADCSACAKVLQGLGDCLFAQERYADAAVVFTKALHIYEKQVGPEDPQVASALFSIAICYGQQSKDSAAKPLLKRSIAIREKTDGPNALRTADELGVLAQCLTQLREYSAAESLLRRTLAICQKALPAKDGRRSISWHRLGECLMKEHKYAEAQQAFVRALEIESDTSAQTWTPPDSQIASDLLSVRKKLHKPASEWLICEELVKSAGRAHGDASPEATRALIRAGRWCYQQEKYAKAIPLFERALSNLDKPKKSSDAHIDNVLVLLGQCYYTQHKNTQATQLFERALSVREKEAAPINEGEPLNVRYQTDSYRKALAELYLDAGQVGKVKQLYERAGKFTELAQFFYENKRYQSAEAVLNEQKRRLDSVCKDLQPEQQLNLYGLELVYNKLGKPAGAEALYTGLVNRFDRSDAKPNPGLADSLTDSGWYFYRHGQFGKAESCFKRSLTVRPSDRSIVCNLYNLAIVAERQGKTAAAEHFYKDALSRCKQIDTLTDSDLADATVQLADFYWRNGRFAQAEPLIKEEKTLLAKSDHNTPDDTAIGSTADSFISPDRLAWLYCSWGRLEQAETTFEELIKNSKGNAQNNFAECLAILYKRENMFGQLEKLARERFDAAYKAKNSFRSTKWQTTLMWVLCQQRKFREAEKLLSEKNSPESSDDLDRSLRLALLAHVQYLQGNYAGAQKSYASLSKTLNNYFSSTLDQTPKTVPFIEEIRYPDECTQLIGVNTSSSTDHDGQVPLLQGATNGTIGPQGGDSFVAEEVNTAGSQSSSINYYTPAKNPFGGRYIDAKGLERMEPLISSTWPPLEVGMYDEVGLGGICIELPDKNGGSYCLSKPTAHAWIQAKRATVFRDWGKYKDAEPLYLSAIKSLTGEVTRHKSFDLTEEKILKNVLTDYAILLRKTNRQAEALRIQARAAKLGHLPDSKHR